MFNFDNIFKTIEEIQPNKKEPWKDERFWKLSRNDDDIGLARIRLLPGKVTKDGKEVLVPYVRIYKYNINLRPFGIKKFTEIESGEGIGLSSEVGKLRMELYKIGKDNPDVKSVLDIIKRSEKYISNIYIVNDPNKSEENGKIKLWEYGVKLKDKFEGWRQPSQEDLAMGAEPLNIWHLIIGADIKLVMKKSGGFYNYDDTTHFEIEPLFDSKEKINEIINKIYSLDEWLQPNHFLTPEEEKQKLRDLFAGTKVEDILIKLGVSLYDDVKVTSKPVQQAVQTQDEKPVKTQKVEEPQAKVEPISNDYDDNNLDFLDDL
jgi:hypothetical protein